MLSSISDKEGMLYEPLFQNCLLGWLVIEYLRVFFLSKQDIAVKTADANGSTIILANDPDADRLALAEKQPE